jgi:Restriction Enzyme Adenine Methylase Associated
MMPTIEVDNEVFGKLQDRARPFIDTPNDIIKRLLDDVDALSNADAPAEFNPPVTVKVDVQRIGRLHGLIEKGLVKPGDKVRHRRKRTNDVFEATITEGGCLKVDGVAEPFREPSPALRHFTGSQIDGWNNFMHIDSGRTLRYLRDNSDKS